MNNVGMNLNHVNTPSLRKNQKISFAQQQNAIVPVKLTVGDVLADQLSREVKTRQLINLEPADLYTAVLETAKEQDVPPKVAARTIAQDLRNLAPVLEAIAGKAESRARFLGNQVKQDLVCNNLGPIKPRTSQRIESAIEADTDAEFFSQQANLARKKANVMYRFFPMSGQQM